MDVIAVPTKIEEVDGTRVAWAKGVIVRLADEGVPIGAIIRAVRQPSDVVRPTLRAAQASGLILTIPRDDWPPGTRRQDRTPDVLPIDMAPEAFVSSIMRTFRVTPAEATIFAGLLRRSEMTKNALHLAVKRDRDTDIKIVDVLVCHLRKKLPSDIKIETIWGRGYYVSAASKNAALKRLHDAGERLVGFTPTEENTR